MMKMPPLIPFWTEHQLLNQNEDRFTLWTMDINNFSLRIQSSQKHELTDEDFNYNLSFHKKKEDRAK